MVRGALVDMQRPLAAVVTVAVYASRDAAEADGAIPLPDGSPVSVGWRLDVGISPAVWHPPAVATLPPEPPRVPMHAARLTLLETPDPDGVYRHAWEAFRARVEGLPVALQERIDAALSAPTVGRDSVELAGIVQLMGWQPEWVDDVFRRAGERQT